MNLNAMSYRAFRDAPTRPCPEPPDSPPEPTAAEWREINRVQDRETSAESLLDTLQKRFDDAAGYFDFQPGMTTDYRCTIRVSIPFDDFASQSEQLAALAKYAGLLQDGFEKLAVNAAARGE